MASLRQIRGRIRSIQSTKQIMRAMQLVSASKLKRAQGRFLQARDMVGFLDGLLQRVLASAPELSHPLCASREGRDTLVLLTSDTGLCGAYNTNLIHMADAHLRRDSLARPQLIFIGKKGHRYFTRRGYEAAGAYLDLAGRPDMSRTERIARELMERFLSGKTSAVHVLYPQFASSTTYRPTVLQWLPVQLGSVAPQAGGGTAPPREYLFEPSAERVFEDLLPRWALAKFQAMLLEAFTSEHSARMIAMKNATDNAEELLKAFTMQRNKIRQAAITKEISEIVGTVEALK